MTRSIQSCTAAIRAAAGRPLSNEEVLQILEAIELRARAKRAKDAMRSTSAALNAAARELGEEARVAALLEKRSRLINIMRKRERFADYDASGNREARALSAINVGREGPEAGAARSVDSERQALAAMLLGPLVGELRAKGLLGVIRGRNAAFDRDVARELWRLSDPAAAESGNRLAAETAAILGKYQEAARLLQNEAGAFIRKLPGWIVRQSHDSYRIGHAAAANAVQRLRPGGTDADFRAWADFIGPRLDDAWAARPVPAAIRA